MPRKGWASFGVLAAGIFAGGVAGCGDALGPTTEVDGLRFTASAQVVTALPPADEPRIEASVSVRNESVFSVERTFDGGCFIRRFQVYRRDGEARRLAWDSDRSDWACTDDLAIVDLAPDETATPHNWRAGVRLSELRDSLPAGRYEIVIGIQAGARTLRAGFVDIE